MPKLIRHILSELTLVFVLALSVFTVLMLIVGLVREAISQNLPPAWIAWLVPFILPDALRVTIPVTLLLATTYVYGRMSGSNEIVAIKALGISPMRIVWPVLAGAFLLSLLTVWLNDLAVSWGREGARRVVIDAVEEIAYNMLRTQRRYTAHGLAINIKRLDGRKLILPTLTLQSRGDTPATTVMATDAELRADRAENVLKIVFNNAQVDIQGRTGYLPGPSELELPLSDASRADVALSTPSTMPLAAIPAQIQRQLVVIEQSQQDQAAQAAMQMLAGDFDALTSPDWEDKRAQLKGQREHLYRLRTEPHRRWSAGFSCLCFVWVGAPMAIWLRNRDFLTSFFLCFAPILVVYYPLLAFGVDGAKNGTLPPSGVWAGNLMLLGAGIYLMRKVIRY